MVINKTQGFSRLSPILMSYVQFDLLTPKQLYAIYLAARLEPIAVEGRGIVEGLTVSLLCEEVTPLAL